MPKYLLPIAQCLHEGQTIYLGSLVLAHLYEGLTEAIRNLRSKGEVGILKGPFWFLQLWSNSIFQNHVQSSIPATIPKDVACYRLTTCTNRDISKQAFLECFSLFSSLTKFEPSLVWTFPCSLTGFDFPLLLIRNLLFLQYGKNSLDLTMQFIILVVMKSRFSRSTANSFLGNSG